MNVSAPQRRMHLPTVAILLTCIAISAACVGYPIYVISPFRPQGARELSAALVVSRFAPLITVFAAMVAIGAATLYWKSSTSVRRRAFAGCGAAFVCVLAVLARVNVYELLFHPVGAPSFAAARRVKLDKDEKVIAVKIDGNARAYPIRSISYHHIVNDVVGKVPIVATY